MESELLSETLLGVLDSVLLPRSVAYVAGPLDTGRTFYETRATAMSESDIRRENEQRLKGFAERLRLRLTYPVFDPGVLRVKNWTPGQHGVFFMQVLERFAKDAWFIDGWEFSHGATKEFVSCIRIGIPCFNEMGQVIGLTSGQNLIRDASEHVDKLGLDGSRLRSRLK